MWLVIILCAYLLGSIPFGLIWARCAGIYDLQQRGSGNIGATNVTRLGGKFLGALTLICDAGKGSLAVLLSEYFAHDEILSAIAALMVVIGHMFPIWLKGHGGKGVATVFGSILVLAPIIAGITALVWVSTLVLCRVSSLAALLGLVVAVISACFLASFTVIITLLLIAVLIIFKHRENIKRLMQRRELKF